MKFAIDAIIVIIISVCIFIGVKKGFIKVFLSALALILSFFLSLNSASVLANYVQKNYVTPKISYSISKQIENGSEDILSALPNSISANAAALGIDSNAITEFADESVDLTADELADNITNKYIAPVIIKLLNAIFLLVLFIVFSVLLNILARILTKFLKALPFSFLDKLGGFIMGLANGFVLVLIFCFVLYVFGASNLDGPLIFNSESVNNSYFYCLFSDLINM